MKEVKFKMDQELQRSPKIGSPLANKNLNSEEAKDLLDNQTYDQFINDFNNSQINIFGKIVEKFNKDQLRKEYYLTKYPMIQSFEKQGEIF